MSNKSIKSQPKINKMKFSKDNTPENSSHSIKKYKIRKNNSKNIKQKKIMKLQP